MSNSNNSRIPDDMADEVMEIASRLYAETTQGYSPTELKAAGSEVEIPPALVEQAIAEVKAKRQAEEQQRVKAEQRKKQGLMVLGGLAALTLVWAGLTHNALSNSASEVDAAWAQVENQLQRRADLIPQLVGVTKASAQQEQKMVELLIKARENYLQAETTEAKQEATGEVNQAIINFQNYAANNPQLQSSQAFTNLQYELAGTANRIAAERRSYNQAVQAYNQKVTSFPASFLGWKEKSFFKAENTEVPKIEL
ncbi:MAG: LemA family protein [Spirulinaceae cyanobacterium]